MVGSNVNFGGPRLPPYSALLNTVNLVNQAAFGDLIGG